MFPSQERLPFLRFADKFFYIGRGNAPTAGYDARIFLILGGEG